MSSLAFNLLTCDQYAVVLGMVNLPSLLALRACSHHTLAVVAAVLQVTLQALCGWFLRYPDIFLTVLVESEAFVGGQVAVRFMLRDLPFRPQHLDVYVPVAAYRAVRRHLVRIQQATMVSGPDSQWNHDNERWLVDHGLNDTSVLQTKEGTIKLHRALTSQALAGIACAGTSAEVSYVNPTYFGTGYPSLLFRHHALFADWKEDDEDILSILRWRVRGLDIRMAARAWEECRGLVCAATKWYGSKHSPSVRRR
ncbi:hypothetical protein OH76DRAFT_1490669 [Lentinus brumalis]|uniref:Uncharacterized protein n=1 Tax=Lentinus brumalis TaxID=2498619 RepID=A0A371CI95_9APHY|nr:hypothetical protein OH76DRAFT_1490669 [Polyporus brumalis]